MRPTTQPERLELDDILKKHSVVRFRAFILKHLDRFKQKRPGGPGLTLEQIGDSAYLFDLMHLYKANLTYFGDEQAKSLRYCIDHAIVTIDKETQHADSNIPGGFPPD